MEPMYPAPPVTRIFGIFCHFTIKEFHGRYTATLRKDVGRNDVGWNDAERSHVAPAADICNARNANQYRYSRRAARLRSRRRGASGIDPAPMWHPAGLVRKNG